MKLVIIDYGAGNIQSLKFAFDRLAVQATLSADPHEIAAADKVIFPGVGEASSAMHKLRETGLDKLIVQLKQPVLGICLGMQLMCTHSEEGNTPGLGIFNVPVTRFPQGVKIPQIGWNQVSDLKGKLFEGIAEGDHFYLVHSYYAPLSPFTISRTCYGQWYTTALQRDNFYGVQFHPEKSGASGERILRNFINL